MALLSSRTEKYIFAGGPLKGLPRSQASSFIVLTLQNFQLVPSLSPYLILISSLFSSYSSLSLSNSLSARASGGDRWEHGEPTRGDGGRGQRECGEGDEGRQRQRRPSPARIRMDPARWRDEHGGGGGRVATAVPCADPVEAAIPHPDHATAAVPCPYPCISGSGGVRSTTAVAIFVVLFFSGFLFSRADELSTCTRKTDFLVRVHHPHGKIRFS